MGGYAMRTLGDRRQHNSSDRTPGAAWSLNTLAAAAAPGSACFTGAQQHVPAGLVVLLPRMLMRVAFVL